MLGTVRLLVLRVNGLQGPRRLMSWSWTNVMGSLETLSRLETVARHFFSVLVLVLVSKAIVFLALVLVSRVTVLVLVLVSRGTVLGLILVSRGTVLVTSLI